MKTLLSFAKNLLPVNFARVVAVGMASVFALQGCGKSETGTPSKREVAVIAEEKPLPVEFNSPIGPDDDTDFACKVDERISWIATGDNFWTLRVRGGTKFKVRSAGEVIVASSSPEHARKELYSLYLKYGPNETNAIAKKFSVEHIVAGCEKDLRSTRGMVLKRADLSEYRLLSSQDDFVHAYLAMTGEKLTDERILKILSPHAGISSGDAFARHDREMRMLAETKQHLATISKPELVVIDRYPDLKHYSFEKSGFEIPDPAQLIMQKGYQYSYRQTNGPLPQPWMPTFNLRMGGDLGFYKPQSEQEAQSIEKLLTANKLRERVYIQLTAAINTDINTRPELNGIVSAMEFIDQDGRVAIRLTAI